MPGPEYPLPSVGPGAGAVEYLELTLRKWDERGTYLRTDVRIK